MAGTASGTPATAADLLTLQRSMIGDAPVAHCVILRPAWSPSWWVYRHRYRPRVDGSETYGLNIVRPLGRNRTAVDRPVGVSRDESQTSCLINAAPAATLDGSAQWIAMKGAEEMTRV
jgi:hypothetical protein